MIKKILIAIDDSLSAMHAVNYGIALAKEVNANIGVVYVTQYSRGNIDAGILPADAEKEMQQRHEVLIDEINMTHPTVDIEEFDPIGKPESEIKNVIELWKPDLLVIGQHTHGFFQKLFGHHTEQHLIGHIKIPLLIVPKKS